MLKSSSPDTSSTSSRAFPIPSTSVNPSLDRGHAPSTDQSDKKYSDSGSVNHTLLYAPLTIKHFCSNEETNPSSSSSLYHEVREGCSSEQDNDVGDCRENPLVVDDSNGSGNMEISHDHYEASHDHIPPHDIHMSSNNEHTGASHDTRVSHSSKYNKQKVASLVVCVLNPYLKKGRISNKVMCFVCVSICALKLTIYKHQFEELTKF